MKSPTMHVDAEDKIVIDALADHMGKILDALQTFGHEGSGWAIAESSPLNEHRQMMNRQFGPQGDWTDHAAGYLGDASLLFLLAQTDHLAVLKQIFTSYTGLMFGCGPPARSLLELNGYVFWMLHPDTDSIRTQASRALLITATARRPRPSETHRGVEPRSNLVPGRASASEICCGPGGASVALRVMSFYFV